jgi:nitrogenase molybdenum-iron protein beta chain
MAKILENPRASCVLGGAAGIALSIDGVVPILHTGPGCSQMTTLGQLNQGGIKTASFMVTPPCTVMLEKVIVFGGMDRLRETIQGATEVFEGDLYFVLTGCAAGIIGDDVNSVILEFQEKNIPVIYADTAGFKGDTYAGYEAALNALIQSVTAQAAAGAKEPLTVNLLGIVPYQDLYWQGTLNELRRVLERIGVKANTFFGVQQRVSAFKEAGRASLNLIFSPWLAKGAEDILRERDGIPSLRFDSYPMGPTETTRFLRTVGERLGVSRALVESVIRDEEAYVYSFFTTMTGVGVEQNSVAIVGDTGNVIATMRFLVNDYGQIPVLAVVTDQISDEQAMEDIRRAIQDVEFDQKPAVFFESDQWYIKEILRGRRGDLTQLYGSALDREIALELGLKYVNHTFPSAEKLIFDKSYAGYRGCLRLLEDLYTK